MTDFSHQSFISGILERGEIKTHAHGRGSRGSDRSLPRHQLTLIGVGLAFTSGQFFRLPDGRFKFASGLLLGDGQPIIFRGRVGDLHDFPGFGITQLAGFHFGGHPGQGLQLFGQAFEITGPGRRETQLFGRILVYGTIAELGEQPPFQYFRKPQHRTMLGSVHDRHALFEGPVGLSGGSVRAKFGNIHDDSILGFGVPWEVKSIYEQKTKTAR